MISRVCCCTGCYTGLVGHLSHNLNSLKGGAIGDCIGDYYRGLIGVKTIAHLGELAFVLSNEPGFWLRCFDLTWCLCSYLPRILVVVHASQNLLRSSKFGVL